MDLGLVVLAIGGVGIVSAAVALGIRHGIDWDHIAAITDITSTTAALEDEEAVLVKEPGVMLTDESHHAIGHDHEDGGGDAGAGTPAHDRERRRVAAQGTVSSPAHAAAVASASAAHAHETLPLHHPHHHLHDEALEDRRNGAMATFIEKQRPALLLGTMYAIGHGAVVFILGLIAILAREVLPDWIDPVMERVVGVTLLFLAAYLFYSLYRYFRGEGEFQMRSRWMIVFAGVRNAWGALRTKFFGGTHEHVHGAQRYGIRTALGIGMIHGVGAETGTQALVIATAVGAQNQTTGIIALVGFVVGLLISNSVITVVSTAGFVSTTQRKWIYVGAGVLAALFSLVVGLVFVFDWGDVLPGLDRYVEWVGGPDA